MLLKNLIKKLIDHTYFADHKVYIELYEHDKENDTLKCYKLNITDVAEGGNVGQEEYTKIVANVASCVEIDNDYVPPSEDEIDMLDLAFGLTETSRLGCQIEMSEILDGLRVAIPEDM